MKAAVREVKQLAQKHIAHNSSQNWKPDCLCSGPHSISPTPDSSDLEFLSIQIARFRKTLSQVPKKTPLGHNLLRGGGNINKYPGSQKKKVQLSKKTGLEVGDGFQKQPTLMSIQVLQGIFGKWVVINFKR